MRPGCWRRWRVRKRHPGSEALARRAGGTRGRIDRRNVRGCRPSRVRPRAGCAGIQTPPRPCLRWPCASDRGPARAICRPVGNVWRGPARRSSRSFVPLTSCFQGQRRGGRDSSLSPSTSPPALRPPGCGAVRFSDATRVDLRARRADHEVIELQVRKLLAREAAGGDGGDHRSVSRAGRRRIPDAGRRQRGEFRVAEGTAGRLVG